jgi:hypothetical protein
MKRNASIVLDSAVSGLLHAATPFAHDYPVRPIRLIGALQFAAHIKAETDKYARVINQIGPKAE